MLHNTSMHYIPLVVLLINIMSGFAKKTMLITGASRGIGLQLVKSSIAQGYAVIACCRKSNPALEQVIGAMGDGGHQVVEGADVDSDAGIAVIKACAETLPTINVLINNAGILTEESLSDMTTAEGLDRMRRQFEVNTLGPLRVTAALEHKLQPGSKVVIITSRMGSMADNSSGGMYGYRVSKSAVNAAAVNLAHSLRPKGVSVALLHPGMVATDMTAKWGGGISVEESCTGIMQRIEATTMATSGQFYHQSGEMLPW